MRSGTTTTASIQEPCDRALPARARRAFTLIELLAVIAIVSLLIAITLPAIGSARETARRTKCLANLRSFGQGLATYMNDSQDVLPLVRPLHDPNAPPNTNDPSLLDVMTVYLSVPKPVRADPNDPTSPYINVADVFKCPSDVKGDDPVTQFRPLWEADGVSYEYFAGELMVGAEALTIEDPARAVTKTYEQPQWRDLPVLLDNGDWHVLRRSGAKRNALFFGDWHTDWASPLASLDIEQVGEDIVQRLLCDITRFGGRPLPGCN